MTNRIRSVLSPTLLTKDQFELAAWAENKLICGIDEVGRGCLAGPLVTAAVILPCHTLMPLLRDSKCMTEVERRMAYAWIIEHAWYAIGIVHHRIIDTQNIHQATLIAMKKALMHVTAVCPTPPVAVVIDAMPLKLGDTSYAHIPVHAFCKGESLSSSIAAASIVAKVTRDALMTHYHSLFPHYCFAEHKGYATKKHTAALSMQPRSLIHRTTFLKESHDGGQQTLC